MRTLFDRWKVISGEVVTDVDSLIDCIISRFTEKPENSKESDNKKSGKEKEYSSSAELKNDNTPASVKNFKVRVLEVSGFVTAFAALRLPYGKETRSILDAYAFGSGMEFHSNSRAYLNPADMKLLQSLVKNGDEHAKVLRGITASCEIIAPRYFHQELDTYRIGAERLGSESTMHIQGQGLSENELIKMKENLTEGTMQKRIWVFSYQTLRRIYFQRHNHRLPQWRQFCEWIKALPFAKEFILGEEVVIDDGRK